MRGDQCQNAELFWGRWIRIFYLLRVIISIPNKLQYIWHVNMYIQMKKYIWHDKFYIQIQKHIWCGKFYIQMQKHIQHNNSISKFRNTFGMTTSISKFEHGDRRPTRLSRALYETFQRYLSSGVLVSYRESWVTWQCTVMEGGSNWICWIHSNCSWNSPIVSRLPWNYLEN